MSAVTVNPSGKSARSPRQKGCATKKDVENGRRLASLRKQRRLKCSKCWHAVLLRVLFVSPVLVILESVLRPSDMTKAQDSSKGTPRPLCLDSAKQEARLGEAGPRLIPSARERLVWSRQLLCDHCRSRDVADASHCCKSTPWATHCLPPFAEDFPFPVAVTTLECG